MGTEIIKPRSIQENMEKCHFLQVGSFAKKTLLRPSSLMLAVPPSASCEKCTTLFLAQPGRNGAGINMGNK
jgi:hypothetical protein